MSTNVWPADMIAFVRALLPPIDEVTRVVDPADIGPMATLPAIYVHLLLLRIEEMEATATIESLDDRAAAESHVVRSMLAKPQGSA